MAELDTSIPLNFLSGKLNKPMYEQNFASNLYKTSLETDKTAKEVAEKAAVKDREEKVRQALASALENGVSLDEAAKAVAKYDPELSFKLLKEFNDDKKEGSPENVRFKLASGLNALNGAISRMESNDPMLPERMALAKSIEAELASDTPSMQRAYTLIKQLPPGVIPTPTPTGTTVTPTPEGTVVNNGEVFRNGKESTTATDWYSLQMIDGYNKPVMTEGANIVNADQSIQSSYESALNDWKKNNKTAKTVGANAKETAEAKSWVNKFLETMRLAPLIDKARTARSELNNIISEVKAGNYAAANLKPFKEVMGAMSASEYGIATDSPAAAMASSIPFVGESIATWLAADKFNSEEQAYERTNAAIDSYNQLISAYIAENLLPKENSTEARIKAMKDSPTVAGLRTALGSKVPKISKGGTATEQPPANAPLKPSVPPIAGHKWVLKNKKGVMRWVQEKQ